MSLPSDPKARKAVPIYTGFIRYFPDAIAACAQLSHLANEQHNPGEPVHWAKEKSTDELDAAMRHMIDHAKADNGEGNFDDEDGVLHAVKLMWRACANVQRLHDNGIDVMAAVDLEARSRIDELIEFDWEAALQPDEADEVDAIDPVHYEWTFSIPKGYEEYDVSWYDPDTRTFVFDGWTRYMVVDGKTGKWLADLTKVLYPDAETAFNYWRASEAPPEDRG
jgi:hypothetical protein